MFDFSRTHWSRVNAVAAGRPEDRDDQRDWEEAWAYLRDRFEPAMRAVARRALRTYGGRVVPVDHDRDVIQDFFRLCLEKQWLERAAPQFGRFRTFVFVLVRRFTRKYVDWLRAKKRAPAGGWVSLDDVLEGFDPETHDVHRDEMGAWVRCLLEVANECVFGRSPRAAQVNAEVFRQPAVSNIELGSRLGWPPSDVARYKFQGKAMLRQELQRSIEHTVASESELSGEIEELLPLLHHLDIVSN